MLNALERELLLWQVGGWCQDMCLNRARQRRRHRRAIEDWFHLSEHAISADGSPGFQDWLHSPASPWHWPPEQEEGQVMLMQISVLSASLLEPALRWPNLLEYRHASDGPCHPQDVIAEHGVRTHGM